ncbi:MAG: hypothetical protein HY360_13010 [Verrucomicrobia bacterium]|nr:hypothetical protein [Verrucomicrobiota bacterium]
MSRRLEGEGHGVRFSLHIDYPAEKMERNQARMEARSRFQVADRVPVGFCLVPRYFTPLFGMKYQDFFKDAETQYYWQLQFLKYRIEHVPEDMICTGTTVSVYPYFDNVLDSEAFGAEVIWPENETLHTRPTIHSVEEMDRFEIPAPINGLWGRTIDWCQQMKGFARETRITFNSREGSVDVAPLSLGGLSPHMIAVDLAGIDFYMWQAECPERCHRFLEKITQGLIQRGRHFQEIDPRPRGAFGIAEDTAQIMSAEMFRDFCAPYANRLFAAFGKGLRDGRGVHMCGQSAHLHQALVKDMLMSSFNLFGYLVEPKTAAKNLGGRTLLWGNINPMLMQTGSKSEVKKACRECLEALAPCGGFMLGDGANVCPGTPVENLAAFTEAAEDYGVGACRRHAPTVTVERKSTFSSRTRTEIKSNPRRSS